MTQHFQTNDAWMCVILSAHMSNAFLTKVFFFGGSLNSSIHYQRIISSSYNKSLYFYTNVSKMIIVVLFLFLCHINFSVWMKDHPKCVVWRMAFAKNTFSFLGHSGPKKKFCTQFIISLMHYEKRTEGDARAQTLLYFTCLVT